MSNIILKPNPFSSYFRIPAMQGRAEESFIWDDLQRTDDEGQEYYDQDGEPLDIYISPRDGKIFKMKVIMFDMEHWNKKQVEDYFAEWNTPIDSIHIID